jgi:hypothetical protein
MSSTLLKKSSPLHSDYVEIREEFLDSLEEMGVYYNKETQQNEYNNVPFINLPSFADSDQYSTKRKFGSKSIDDTDYKSDH